MTNSYSTTIGDTQSAQLWYNLLQKSYDRQESSFEKTPAVARNIKAFNDRIDSIDTVDDLLEDRQVREMVLSAYQLEDQVDAIGLLKKLLTEDPKEKTSVAYRLADSHFRAFATAMESLGNGEKPFSSEEFRTEILEGYKTNEFEKSQEDVNPAIRQALYFKRMIGKVTSLSQVMADKTLKEVARVAGNLPESVNSLEYDQQKPRYAKTIDIEKLSDPAYIDSYIQKFLVRSDLATLEESISAGTLSPIAALMSPLSADDTAYTYTPISIDFTNIDLWA